MIYWHWMRYDNVSQLRIYLSSNKDVYHSLARWCDMKAYNGVTHPWYWNRMGYPWKLWVPRNMHQKHTEYVEGLYDGLDTEIELETQV